MFKEKNEKINGLKSMPNAAKKYQSYPQINLPNRQWVNNKIEKAPIWCSVDLRDGNQALIDPMGLDRKIRFFQLLCEMGFKEIEVGFPSASQTDFDFVRWCAEHMDHYDDVSLQILVQCRADLIHRSFEALEGIKNPIIHFYNSTSVVQRQVVFNKDIAGIKKLAVDAAKLLLDTSSKLSNPCRFEYSPESFTGTELEVALEICNAVIEEIQPNEHNPLIVNLPSTVEMSMPNIYADQIEWMCRNLHKREHLIISVHPHNDRGCAIAAAELGLLAGADRVEGTIFGNGERTGNVDLVTMALNLYTQGVDPLLDCSNIDKIRSVYEYCNQMKISERHPYVGDLVYTAFSGSHQDAIRKGMKFQESLMDGLWFVPYLPIDPKDVGRSYEAIIRINSQSGKGGISYILQQDYGFELPRSLQISFQRLVQKQADLLGCELSALQIYELFYQNYIKQDYSVFNFVSYQIQNNKNNSQTMLTAQIKQNDQLLTLSGQGTGPIEAFVLALQDLKLGKISLIDYHEHALSQGAAAQAVGYISLKINDNIVWGVGVDADIICASLKAILSACNNHCQLNQLQLTEV